MFSNSYTPRRPSQTKWTVLSSTSNVNVLEWWKRHSDCYPSLACLVKCMLCVPATSVPAEQVFLTVGLAITHQQCSLNPDNADMLIFLQKNLPR